MNSRLKFRAWDKKYKYMNYKVLIGNIEPDAGENWTAHAMYIYPDKVDYKCEPHWTNIDQDSIVEFMQCIGSKDKNGKDIFEGDVLEWTAKFKETDTQTHQKIGQVKHNQQGCVHHINYKLDSKTYYRELMATFGGDFYLIDTVEIIGNVYENPDLLK